MKIIYENDNGGVSVVHPAHKSNSQQVSLSVIREDDSDAEILRKTKAIKAQKYLFAIMKDGDITEDEWLTFITMKDVPDGTPSEIVDASEIPVDRVFRGAWKKNGRVVQVDMPKARLIHMDRIRQGRNKELEESDRELARELERGPASKTLKDKRQMLRDIPQNLDLDLVATPEELKDIWPVDVPRNF